jgi:hypothetical protein
MSRYNLTPLLVSILFPTLFATAIVGRSAMSDVHASTPGIVGSWLLTITPSGAAKNKALVTYTAGGRTIEVASAPFTHAPPGSAGLGTWVGTAGNQVRGTIVFLLTEASGQFTGLVTARTTETVSRNYLKGYSAVTFSDTRGRITRRGTSTFTGVRI